MSWYRLLFALAIGLVACNAPSEPAVSESLEATQNTIHQDSTDASLTALSEAAIPLYPPELDTIWQQPATYIEGDIGGHSIQLYLHAKAVDEDSSTLDGLYWYTNHYKPLQLQGSHSKKSANLTLHHHLEEFFDVPNFQFYGDTTNGTWKKDSQQLTCHMAPVVPNTASLIEYMGVMLQDLGYIHASSNEYIVINKAFFKTQEAFINARITTFNSWQLSIHEERDEYEHITKVYHWLRLPSAAPFDFLYIEAEQYLERIEVEDEETGAILTPLVDYTIVNKIQVIRQEEWGVEDLDELVAAINKDIEVGKADNWNPIYTPSVLFGDHHYWVWDGYSFEKH